MAIRTSLKEAIYKLVQPLILRLLSDETIVFNPYISGKLFPLQGRNFYYTQTNPTPSTSLADDGLPVPPQELWEGWLGTPKDYLASGRKDISAMVEILDKAGACPETLYRVLELGCAAARMLRSYPYTNGKSELWGVDIKAKHISWCQQHLSPPFFFATTTNAPHLPFEDNHFDLVFCGSVFTHISDLADAWFLELRRILRRGGYAYITIHDKHSLDVIMARDRNPLTDVLRRVDKETSILSQDYAYFSILTEPKAQVFYDAEYLAQKWSRFAKVLSVTKEAMDYQTALLLQKQIN